MGINLLPSSDKKNEKWIKIRRIVMGISSAVLALDIVVVSGSMGWWWYSKSREVKTSSEVVSNLKNIEKYYPVEAALRQINGRLGLLSQVSEFESVLKTVENIMCPGSVITNWGWESGKMEISAYAESGSDLVNCSKIWKDKYPLAKGGGATLGGDGKWTTHWVLEGGSK